MEPDGELPVAAQFEKPEAGAFKGIGNFAVGARKEARL
jgi:hypothetical protein